MDGGQAELVLAHRMYTAAPTGKSREQLYALLFNKAARGSETNPYEEKHTVDLDTLQSRQGGSNAKSGCCTTKVKVRHWSRTFRAFYRLSGQGRRCSC